MDWWSVAASDPAFRIVAAALVGAIIGLDRELLRKPLGFRTLSIVSIASCALVVAAEQYELTSSGHADVVGRAVQGLMAGVGFLGGGVILHTGRDHVRGLTTAALVWLTAALGVACGFGAWKVVATSLVLTLLLLWIGGPLEKILRRRRARNDGPMPGDRDQEQPGPQVASRSGMRR